MLPRAFVKIVGKARRLLPRQRESSWGARVREVLLVTGGCGSGMQSPLSFLQERLLCEARSSHAGERSDDRPSPSPASIPALTFSLSILERALLAASGLGWSFTMTSNYSTTVGWSRTTPTGSLKVGARQRYWSGRATRPSHHRAATPSRTRTNRRCPTVCPLPTRDDTSARGLRNGREIVGNLGQPARKGSIPPHSLLQHDRRSEEEEKGPERQHRRHHRLAATRAFATASTSSSSSRSSSRRRRRVSGSRTKIHGP
jgi:hypothetical protein